MRIKLEGMDRIDSKMELVLALHLCSGALKDIVSALPTRTFVFPSGDKDPLSRIAGVSAELSGLISELMDGTISME